MKIVRDKIKSLERMGYTVITDIDREVIQVKLKTKRGFSTSVNNSINEFLSNDHIVEQIIYAINDSIIEDF